MRHVDEGFAVEFGVLRRRNGAVGNDVVEEIGAVAAGETQIGDPQGGRAQGRDLQPVSRRMTVQIDQDVDLVLENALRRLGVVELADVDEGVTIPLDSFPVGAAVIVPVGIGDHAEGIPVVAFEKAGDQVGDGMVAKIARQVSKCDFCIRPAVALQVETQIQSCRAFVDIGAP